MAFLYGNELNEYYVSRIRDIHARWEERLKTIRTKKQALAYTAEIRRKVRSLFELPAEKTPLNPQITGTVRMEGYTIEKVILESRPGYHVTGNLYIPGKTLRKGPGKLPCVLHVCGHSANGKEARQYQDVCAGLVLKGFQVFCVDPVGQGERIESERRNTTEHNMLGRKLELTGEFLGTWRVWDGIRSLDYLLSRPEADPKRCALTGNSGGGTLSTWLNAVEDRFTMTAIDCYVTSWLHNIENEEAADNEQMVPGALAEGLEMGDFLLAAAPRTLLLNGQINDFFDYRGTIETYEALKPVYELLGGTVRYFIGPTDHGYFQENRESMLRLFTEMAYNDPDGMEDAHKTLPEEKLHASPKGRTLNVPGNRTLYSQIVEKAELLGRNREKLSVSALKKVLKEALQCGEGFVPYYSVPREETFSGKTPGYYSRFRLETEPNRFLSIIGRADEGPWYHVQEGVRELTLYVGAVDTKAELEARGRKKNEVLYGIDVRGIGELRGNNCAQGEWIGFFHDYHTDYHFAALGYMLREPLLGKRVKDILCAAELLAQDGAVIHLESSGIGCVPAMMAALLSDKIATVKLKECPESWESIIRDPGTEFPLSCTLYGILKQTDLPEIRKALGKKLS